MTEFLPIDGQDLQRLLQDPRTRIIDVRSSRAYAAGHLPGARHFTRSLLGRMRREWPGDVPIVVYDDATGASEQIAQLLNHLGFTAVHSLRGSYAAWRMPRSRRSAGVLRLSAALRAWLLDQGFDTEDLERATANGMTALLQACRIGHAAHVHALLEAGASHNAVTVDGTTALWLACFADSPLCALHLIERGFDVDHANPTGDTALMYAASAGRDRMVRLLLEAGADPGRCNQDGFTAFDMAATQNAYFLLRPKRPQVA
jgi:thiosulfate/3-mercaptopyruvate sulfurtransferase